MTSLNTLDRLAVNYLFLSDNGHTDHSQLEIEPFNAAHEQNDYEVRTITHLCQD